MEKDSNQAAVYFKDKKAGILSKTPAGFEFIYDSEYLNEPTFQPISLSLPRRVEKYASSWLFSFFSGLLPEGWLLELISKTAKIDQEDQFRLLLQTGRDPIGAVSLRPLMEDENG